MPPASANPAVPDTPAVALHAAAKVFGAFIALRPTTLSIPRNTITVVLGVNGAGKSTLLRLIAGLAAPTHGTLEVLGAPPQNSRGRIAYMSHAPLLYDELSASENLAYFASLNSTGPVACACTASPEMALRAVGLDPHLTRPIAQYSQGMRQRASLARALHADPELLLLDEPFSNLDPTSCTEIVHLLQDFRSWPHPQNPHGRTIILTTHQAHIAAPLADLTLTLEAGSITQTVPVKT